MYSQLNTVKISSISVKYSSNFKRPSLVPVTFLTVAGVLSISQFGLNNSAAISAS
jgi:hypothetical protein